MAENAQDRQLPATQRKIEKSRSEGQVARSRDLSHVAAIGTGLKPRLFAAVRILSMSRPAALKSSLAG